MLRAPLLSLIPALIPTLAGQVPLNPVDRQQSEYHRLGDDDWSLYKLPETNATDHLVFETVHSLLQHWPNTRMRNGHTIVPGTIPKGTLLYHGTSSNELPEDPDWVATDPEHSYLFCWDWDSPQGCWHLTLATTRPLKVIYFDGSSAVKLPYGSMDTQSLLAWGVSDPDNADDEEQRIEDLCNWGNDFDIDGFVRMEMDFEVMLCDFTSGVSVVSFVSLVNQEDVWMSDSGFFEVMNSGSWHNHFPGETRVQLDPAGLISFYDTQLVPSLIDVRVGQERWDHRVQKISSEDLSSVKSRLEAYLVRPEGMSSGIDWRTLFQVIVDRYAGRLELTRYFLDSSVTEPDDILSLASKAQTQLRTMLTPYILYSATPPDPSDRSDLNWTIPVYKLCTRTHTYSMESEMDTMTESEKLLLRAVRGTTREICRVVTKMWATGVYAGIDSYLNTNESPDVVEMSRVWNTWRTDLAHLMEWLDWNIWVKCDPECGSEEMCYLPTWPIGFPDDFALNSATPPSPGSNKRNPERLTSLDVKAMARERLADKMEYIVEPEPDDWIRPQPKCVRRVDPYDF